MGVYQIDLSTPSRRLQLAIKWSLEIVVAVVALILLSALLAVLALLIRLESPWPAVLAQRRLERGGRVFIGKVSWAG